MTINTMLLIVVAALAVLALAGMIAGVGYKTRTRQRHVYGETLRGQAGEDELRLRHQETLADEALARAHAAQVEVDIKTVRADRLQRQAAIRCSEAVAARDEVDAQKGSA